MTDHALQLDDEECHELLAALFPQGLSGEDVMSELAPGGWESSPLSRVAHPSPEQLYEEAMVFHRGMEALVANRRVGKAPPDQHDSSDAVETPSEAPSLEKIRQEYESQPVDPPRELRELVGMCLWDVFSDNHEVVASDGRIVELGSHRSAAGFVAEFVNRSLGIPPGTAEAREIEWVKRLIGKGAEDLQSTLAELAEQRSCGDRAYDYMDFYMGTRMISGRADLRPVYRMIFRRLKQTGCDWRYRFPRLYLADLRPLRDAMQDEEREDASWSNYDPSAAFETQQADAARDEEIAAMRGRLDEAYRESVEAARGAPPPATVAAYRDAYDDFPSGWPPKVED
jgi:hypothetical protein